MHERLFPRYWHSSDYMQHRIIGPVVVQVYEHDRERDRSGDPLQPGIYHAYPKVAEWDAPGPILRDEQLRVTVQSTKRGVKSGTTIEIFRPEPAAQSPNPGWPLPGHVMTHPAPAPGPGYGRSSGWTATSGEERGRGRAQPGCGRGLKRV